MSFIIIAFVFVCVPLMESHRIPPKHTPTFRCDYTYVTDIDGWYKLHKTPAKWSDAVSTCTSEGANILFMESQDIIKFQTTVLKEFSIESVHTGIKFATNDPTVVQQETFQNLAMLKNGTLKYVDLNEWHPFICHKKKIEAVTLTECGTVDREYYLDNRTNKCYKFHRIHSTWYDAKMSCKAEGGHLVIINSLIETSAIIDLFAKHPADSLPGFYWNDNAFVGVMSDDNGLTWSTVDGQTLQESGYAEFSSGEPNNARGDEYCVSVGRNGKLFDDPCYRELPYICEKAVYDIVCREQDAVMLENNEVYVELEVQDKADKLRTLISGDQ